MKRATPRRRRRLGRGLGAGNRPGVRAGVHGGEHPIHPFQHRENRPAREQSLRGEPSEIARHLACAALVGHDPTGHDSLRSRAGLDIEPFIVAVFEPGDYPTLYPECNMDLGDMNLDGSVDAFDIEPFLDLLFP